MLNPVFLLFMLITLIFSFYSLSNWKLGLLVFFIYIQIFGFIKRVILSIGLDNISYNVLVVAQYIFLLCIILGGLRKEAGKTHINTKINSWILSFSVLLIISILISNLSFGTSVTLSIIQFFPLYIILIGQYVEEKQIDDIKQLLIKSAPIHCLYQIYQFFFGPFGFELEFLDNKSAITNFSEGDFVRGIPLYDSVDPLYIHLTLVFLCLLKRQKKSTDYLIMFLIITTLIMIGNRSGVILLCIGIFIFSVIELKIPGRKMILSFFSLLLIISLNVFSFLLLDVIQSIETINISSSDFGSRWGSLGTYTERIIGRQKATENISLFGLGLGTSGLAASTLANKGMNYDAERGEIFAHDLVGEIILDFGIIGLIVFGFLIYYLFKYSLNNRLFSPLFAIILSSFIASSLLGGSFTYGRAGYFIFLFIGYLIGRTNLLEKQSD